MLIVIVVSVQFPEAFFRLPSLHVGLLQRAELGLFGVRFGSSRVRFCLLLLEPPLFFLFCDDAVPL